jgi:uncharacterized membrane protein
MQGLNEPDHPRFTRFYWKYVLISVIISLLIAYGVYYGAAAIANFICKP